MFHCSLACAIVLLCAPGVIYVQMHGSPSRGIAHQSAAFSSPLHGGGAQEFLVKQCSSFQKKLASTAQVASSERHLRETLQEELFLHRGRSEESQASARKEAAARVAAMESAGKAARERDAAQVQARRALEKLQELELERAATKRVLKELYAANEAIEAENRTLQQTVNGAEAAVRAEKSAREFAEAEARRLSIIAAAAREVAKKSMEVAEAAEEERDGLLTQVHRLKTLLKRTNEAASIFGFQPFAE